MSGRMGHTVDGHHYCYYYLLLFLLTSVHLWGAGMTQEDSNHGREQKGGDMQTRDSSRRPTADDILTASRFPAPHIGDYVPSACWNFTYGNQQGLQEFYSPNFPNNYDNGTTCTQVLAAPPGFVIKLEFQFFKIEPSYDCEYDYLEIHDGPYGYSPLIGRFCGAKPPPLIKSTSQFMWIHFETDGTIEYKGFQAVYEFVNQPNTAPRLDAGHVAFCRLPVATDFYQDGNLTIKDLPPGLVVNAWNGTEDMDCTWEIFVRPGQRVHLKVSSFEMKNPLECSLNFLEIYDRTTSIHHRERQFCTPSSGEYKSGSNRVYLRFHLHRNIISEFKVDYTIFEYGPCRDSLFDCGDQTCISPTLKCNGRINCNFSYDEMKCKKEEDSLTTPLEMKYHAVILGVVGGLLVIIVAVSICLTVRHRREEARLRQKLRERVVLDPVEIQKLLLTNMNEVIVPNTPTGLLDEESALKVSRRFHSDDITAVKRNGVFHISLGNPSSQTSSRGRGNQEELVPEKDDSDYETEEMACGNKYESSESISRILDEANGNGSSRNATPRKVPTVVCIETPPRQASLDKAVSDPMLSTTSSVISNNTQRTSPSPPPPPLPSTQVPQSQSGNNSNRQSPARSPGRGGRRRRRSKKSDRNRVDANKNNPEVIAMITLNDQDVQKDSQQGPTTSSPKQTSLPDKKQSNKYDNPRLKLSDNHSRRGPPSPKPDVVQDERVWERSRGNVTIPNTTTDADVTVRAPPTSQSLKQSHSGQPV
ncbi:uncharacterized protein LOC106179240 isoform X2 [Lingula anatina]|nr:uncharacterized protein LOC106179240 isoform X2 [Lingula anatina]XP_013418236.1 uncharacterized protein LOC106179240 isoform X2 [Lingula anatina]|eukprot:XP_013418235.1 uncharacterized protein LOC106179240 isoform X2 [Lingula anatina]